jgi:mRNA-degrading endonuclease RelE of RelBE toxin-antitoxin system
MSCRVETASNFRREAKKLIKKYASLKAELLALYSQLEDNPTMGVPLGGNFFKVRLAIASKGKGKSGGARIITYWRVSNEEVLLLSIYDKGTQNDISDVAIRQILIMNDELL